jgi:lipopolysaccharide/colanic/teichoic acid biosynthesis glycosyltransferase/NDP-sugar pyrophosphorylase family protein
MKAIILSGGERTLLMPLTKSCPTAILPVLNTPFLEHTIRFLRQMGVKEIAIAFGTEASSFAERLGDGSQLDVRLHTTSEEYPQGTAGALRSLKSFVQEGPFFVISGSTFLSGANLPKEIFKAVAFHLEQEAVATLLVTPREKPHLLESIQPQESEKGVQFHRLHPIVDRRKRGEFYGIYIFSPTVFRSIPSEGYVDIKEQLLPLLHAEGLPVRSYLLDGIKRRSVESIESYYQLNHDLLTDPYFLIEEKRSHHSYRQILDGIWIGKDVYISPNAYLLGPMVIGDRCRLERGAQVIGPTVLGPSTVVGKGALVRESIAWDQVRLEEESRASYCIIETSSILRKGEVRNRNIVMKEQNTAEAFNLAQVTLGAYSKQTVSDVSIDEIFNKGIFKRWLFSISKRSIDLTCSFLGLFLISPLFLFIALVIKYDSPGPVLFRQRRCGRGGKEFWMIKFRTMTVDAEKKQKELHAQNNVDGPVFKLYNDPRVTRVGRFLRKTSLDELPQLFNVLNGEMSLVGPRPLMMREMKYSPAWRDMRLRVKPGVTGLWQLRGRSRPGFHEWIRQDIEYVKKQSFFLDVQILLKTALVVFKGV